MSPTPTEHPWATNDRGVRAKPPSPLRAQTTPPLACTHRPRPGVGVGVGVGDTLITARPGHRDRAHEL